MARKSKPASKFRTFVKWMRRISFVVGVVSAVRQWQMERNQQQKTPPSQ